MYVENGEDPIERGLVMRKSKKGERMNAVA